MNDLKIGIIAPVDLINNQPFGGITGFLCNILGEFHHQIFIYGIGVNRSVANWKSETLRPNVHFIPIARTQYPSYIPMRLKALLFYSLYRSRILCDGIDLLYIQSPESALPFLFGRYKLPVVYHQHGSFNPVAKSAYRFARSMIFQKFFDFILKLVHQKSDWIIAIDKLCIKQVSLNHSSHKVSLIMNAVDTKIFRPNDEIRRQMRERYCLGTDRVILFAGRLDESKRIDIIIKSMSLLVDKKKSCRAFIVGEGIQRKALEKLAMDKGLGEGVTFVGFINHKELPAFYNMADVLVIPSEREGVPMVVLEALACGMPVVASNIGGIADIVTNKINGVLLKKVSPDTVAQAVRKVFSSNLDPFFIAESIQNFSSQNMARHLEATFEQLVRNRKNKK